MKGLLSIALAATLLSTASAIAQSASPTDPGTSSNSLAENSSDQRAPGDAATAGAEQRIEPLSHAPLATAGHEDALKKASIAAEATQRRLVDSDSGCATFVPQGIDADAMSWAGSCKDGLADGAGTVTYLNGGHVSEAIDGFFAGGGLQDGKVGIRWADGSRYEGKVVAGAMQGSGTLVTAAGDKFDGQWKAGRLDGKAVAIWANGDRYDGEWRNGKANGRGVQDWADGRQYIGDWQNDLPNGHGVIRRKDGSRYEGDFVDGQPNHLVQLAVAAADDANQPAPVVTPAKSSDLHQTAKSNPASTVPVNGPSPAEHLAISGVANKKLVAVDGSSLTLTTIEDGLTREIVAPNGNVKKNTFSFLGDRVGAVSEGDDTDDVTGVFRLTEKGIVTNYSDGRAEDLYPNTSGGISMTLSAPTGQTYCMAWYPAGHRFSVDERKAALAAYASKLGLDEPGKKPSKVPAKPACTPLADAQPMPSSTDAPAPAADHHAAAATKLQPLPRPNPHEATAHALLHSGAPHVVKASFAAPVSTAPAVSTSVATVEVRPSKVHVIDADASPTSQPGSLPVLAANEPAKKMSASNCLSVESNGQHWAFHNHCGYDVQFAYCLMNGDSLSACSKGAAAGSVAPNGSSALVVDHSLSEKDVDHDFRWVACAGGAGEVVVHLDRADPPTGRCERRSASE